MEQSTRRAWSRPELIVLVRTRPEEAVLSTCKDVNTGGPQTGQSNCSGASQCNAQDVS